MSNFDEKALETPDQRQSEEDHAPVIGEKSPGVERIEALEKHITFQDRCRIFFGLYLIAYAYGLDGTLRYVYQVNIPLRAVHVWTANDS